ncbi:MAG: hypothetical protein IE937_12900 [Gammaproteobacteria bacterium]|nr:hypothetical protein [Gammaproteobacteria bacterium]
MKKAAIFYLISLLTMAGCVSSSIDNKGYKPVTLSKSQLAQVQMGIGLHTGLPNLLLVHGVTAATSPEGHLTACGITTLDEAGESGSYFIGLFSGERFNVVSIADDWSSQNGIRTMCEQRGMKVGARGGDASDARSAEVTKHLEQYKELDRRCRGADGANSDAVCVQRNHVAEELEGLGWCLGKVWQASYQQKWHMCGPDSNRPSTLR